MSKKKNKGNYNVYISDVDEFKRLREKIIVLYYKRYGKTLTKGELMEVALNITINVLKNENYTTQGTILDSIVHNVYGRIE
jgi:hypothetical protein